MQSGTSKFRSPFLGFAAGFLVVALLGYASFASGLVGEDSPSSEEDVTVATPQPDSPAEPPVKEVPEALEEDVALLDTPVARDPETFGDEELGLNYDLARDARTPDGERLVVVPGQELTCLEDGDGNQSCVGAAQVLAGALFNLQLCSPDLAAGSTRIFGLLPDGAEVATVTTFKGESIELPVENNLYGGDIEGLPNLLSWTDSEGIVHEVPIASEPGTLSECANAN